MRISDENLEESQRGKYDNRILIEYFEMSIEEY